MLDIFRIRFSFLLLLFFFLTTIVFGQSEKEKGIDLYNAGEYEKAIENLQNAVKTDEKDRNAWLYLGMSLARTKRKGEAMKALRKGDALAKNTSEYDKDVKIISKPRARYTDAARQNMVSGKVRIAIEFGADGNIKSVVAFQTLPDGLTENCLQAVSDIKFEPAYKNGKPVNSITTVEYNFEIY